MRAITLAAAFILTGVVGAWSADCMADGAPLYFTAAAPAAFDGTKELKWDSGFGSWWGCWTTTGRVWIGNDFDISTLSAYRAISAIKLQSYNSWPNRGWDGFNVGVYSFSGGVPGSLLWGPAFVLPTGATGWKEFSVGWTLPAGVYKFLAGQEQFYNYPNCDPYLIDNNPTYVGHSWMYTGGNWRPFENPYTLPYRNLVIRVIVNDETVTVAPTSVGRVKALYY